MKSRTYEICIIKDSHIMSTHNVLNKKKAMQYIASKIVKMSAEGYSFTLHII